MHVVIYLPKVFHSAVAATIGEAFQTANDLSRDGTFTIEFVSKRRRPTSTTGVSFPAKSKPSRKMNALILLAPSGLESAQQELDQESVRAAPLIRMAQRQQATIAAHCSGAWLLAHAGLLDGKRATISWWLKTQAADRFPRVRWNPSVLIQRQGRIYTSGGGFSGLELLTRLLVDLGFAKEARLLRKWLVLPPVRRFQTPYEIAPNELPGILVSPPFENRLNELSIKSMHELNSIFLAQQLGLSVRTLARKFVEELQTTPGKWIQARRLHAARSLLETSSLSISEVCYRVGYRDVASFSRLFSRTTGMAPGTFRKQLQS